MKKFSLLLKVTLAATAVFFASCKGDDAVDPVGPSLNFVGATTKSFSVKPSDTVSFDIVTAKGDKNMDKLTFRIAGNPVAAERILVNGTVLSTAGEYKIKASEDAGKTYTIQFVTSSTATTENLILAVIDNDALTAGLTVNVTTTAYSITSYSAVLLGAQSAAAGSYLNTGGMVKQQADATTASDIMLSFAELGLTFDGTLISPNTTDRKAEGLTKGSDNSATTYFATTSLGFDATGEQIANATVGTANKKIAAVKNGVYLFEQGSIKGLVKVTAIVDSINGTGSVTIEVKKITVSKKEFAEVVAVEAK